MTTLVDINHVSFHYGGPAVLKDVTCVVEPGQFTGIVGPSGSGKTTLLNLMLGTVTAQHGSVSRAPNTAVSYVPQLETVNWNFPVSVNECVLMSRATRPLSPFSTARSAPTWPASWSASASLT